MCLGLCFGWVDLDGHQDAVSDGAVVGDALALLWAGMWIGILSIGGVKSMRYVVPAYPALALFVAALPVRIHSPKPVSRAVLFSFLG